MQVLRIYYENLYQELRNTIYYFKNKYFPFGLKRSGTKEQYLKLFNEAKNINYESINKFEKETKLPVIFAAHPKAPNHMIEKFPDLLKGIEYQIDNTGELVKNSNMVLLHQSTAFAFAVLFNKPAIFLTSNKLRNSWIGPRIDNAAKNVNGQIINMDNDLNKPLDLQNLLKIDAGRYKNYLDQYIKVPNSPDVPLWEIFTNYIKSNQFGK